MFMSGTTGVLSPSVVPTPGSAFFNESHPNHHQQQTTREAGAAGEEDEEEEGGGSAWPPVL